jgi:hypothetical protein
MRRGQVHRQVIGRLVKWLCRPSENVLPTTNKADVGPHFKRDSVGRETRSSSFHGRVICLVSLVGVLVMSALLVVLEDRFQFSTKRAWVAHIFPQSPEIWDNIHQEGRKLGEGGVWGYGDWVKDKDSLKYLLTQPKYDRLADMSCSVGIVLSTLQERNPQAEHFGSDISHVMVNQTKQRCKKCHVAQFDLGQFQQPEGEVVPYVFPGTFDYVLVEDVLIYIAWGGWPPFFLRVCEPCRRMVLTHQKRWLQRVKAITRRTVIFSSHQGNPIVTDMFRGLGGELHEGVPFFGSDKAQVLLYLVNGTAGAGN